MFKIRKNLLLLTLIVLNTIILPVSARNFSKNLARISRMRNKKQYASLARLLEKAEASPELEDLRLFLFAECLKNLNKKEAAAKVYDSLLATYPETEAAYQARFQRFLLAVEEADAADLPRLEGFARALPTAWQRGTALFKISELEFLKPGRKSRFILLSLREFFSEKPFYKSAPDSHKILKSILENTDSYLFTDDEWLEVFLFASDENQLGHYFKARNVDNRLFGKWGNAAAEVFKAEWLSQANKKTQALTTLKKVIADSTVHNGIRALAFQKRAYINYTAQKYETAIHNYRKALEYPGFPVNLRASAYRLMRSAFYVGRDSECLEMLHRLVRDNIEPEPLLPIHIYDMGLDRYDNNRKQASLPFFMFLSRHFPGHYRADDAIGYSVFAAGKDTEEGRALIRLLSAKYPNSFFLYWTAPEKRNTVLPQKFVKPDRLDKKREQRLKAFKKLWQTDFASFAREEARKFTDKYPRDLSLYFHIIKVCEEAGDYNGLTAYGERLARQILEAGGSLAEMPDWAWKAHYPKAYLQLVSNNAKKFGIDPFWILSIMREESHFRPDTLSRSNAMSLMQILPSTGKWIAQKVGHRPWRKNDLWKPEVNIKFGSWYLKYLSDLFNGDLFLASASYNGGQGNIQRKVEKGPFAHLPVLQRLDRVPMSETRDYFKKVMGSYWNYQRLYKK
jgi:soluble lytic murein transglycosylase